MAADVEAIDITASAIESCIAADDTTPTTALTNYFYE
jgi:hypothetical protein